MPDWEKLTEHFSNILASRISNVLCCGGVGLVLLSFVQFTNGKPTGLSVVPNTWIFVTGWIFVIVGILLHVVDPSQKLLLSRTTLHKGINLKADSVEICLKVGDIASIPSLNQNCAIVLPANTSFLDDCLLDRNSALGSFFLTHYVNEISTLTKTIQTILAQSSQAPTDDGSYPAGTTIILPSPFNRPCPLLITASTIRKVGAGIVAGPTTVCECIRNIFIITADKKISTLHMPILGAGHGGLEKFEALLFLVLCIRHYARTYHHIKRVEVVILERDTPALIHAYKLQYFSFLAE